MKKLLKEPKEFLKEFEKLNSEKKDKLSDEVVDQIREVMKQNYNSGVNTICNVIRKHAEAIIKYHDARKITKNVEDKKEDAKPEEKNDKDQKK
jgi:hypothetical protein